MRFLSTILVFLLSINKCFAFSSAPESFSLLVEKSLPAVVNISVTQKVKSGNFIVRGEFPKGSPLEEFNELFERFGIAPPGMMDDSEGKDTISAMGSGFIIDPKGYVVTNVHVVADADEITVILNDDTKYKAELIGTDPKTDLALLKVKSEKDLPYLSFANSDDAKVGDWIIAIGNPFGLGGSVSAGIISAKSRDIQAGSFDEFIQTDAAINKGNSGGPMINMMGQVVGINTAIVSPTGGNVGIGFAIPSSFAKNIIDQLKNNGTVKRGWLGVMVHPVSEDIAKSIGLQEDKGAIVVEVQPGSPAFKNGILEGDVIVKVNNIPVTTSRTLPKLIASIDIGSEAEIEIFRDGSFKKIKVKILESPSDNKSKKILSSNKAQEKLGMVLKELSLDEKIQIGLDKKLSGLLVSKVEKNSLAAKSGILKGDFIVQISNQNISGVNDFENIISNAIKSNKDTILVLLIRNKQKCYIGVKIK